ncbi:MAG: DUF2934 domain-containing protein [Chromatiaceae bacterium]|nr:DUF2934 domain-containing protein [Chromatiaceae bacterium]
MSSMNIQSENLSSSGVSPEGRHTSAINSHRRISPAERWLLIAEKAYSSVQRRGFVGGDPFVDWAEAEREVDASYDTEGMQLFLTDDVERLYEQVKRVFGGFGLGYLNLDTILEKHREGLDILTEYNRLWKERTSMLAYQQTALFQDAVNDAMGTLQAFSQGRVDIEGFARRAELSARTMENILSYFKDLTESVSALSSGQKNGDSRG